MTSKIGYIVKILVKVTVTFVLLGWVLFNVDATSLETVFATTKFPYIASAVLMHGFAYIVLSARWWLLYNAQQPQCKYRDIASSYYLGLFFNNFLPTSMGGDLIRFFHLYSAGFNSHLLISSTLLDRIIGLFSIILMGMLSILFLPELNLSKETYLLIVVLTLLLPIGTLLLFSKCTSLVIGKISNRFSTNTIGKHIVKVLIIFSEYKNKWGKLFKSLLLSCFAQSLVILCYILIGLGLDIQLTLSTYFAVVPLIFLATSIPISIGGIGIRESVIVYLFTYFGTDTQSAIALSLIYFTAILVLTLPGALVMLFSKKQYSAGKDLASQIVNHNAKSHINA